jgi:ABC-type transport system substrate-binding protein
MVSWAQGQMEFTPNENYWDKDAVILDRLVFTMVENESTELTMFETGEIDFTHTVPVRKFPAWRLPVSWLFFLTWEPTTTSSRLKNRLLMTSMSVKR